MKNLEKDILEYLRERGWDNLRPSDLAKSISIEAGELLEIFQWDSVSIEETKKDPERLEKIKRELADIFIYALDMSVLLDLDTEKIIREKLEHVKKKFPPASPEQDDEEKRKRYIAIKEKYRREGLS